MLPFPPYAPVHVTPWKKNAFILYRQTGYDGTILNEASREAQEVEKYFKIQKFECAFHLHNYAASKGFCTKY